MRFLASVAIVGGFSYLCENYSAQFRQDLPACRAKKSSIIPVWRGHRDRVVSAVEGAFEHPLNTYVCRQLGVQNFLHISLSSLSVVRQAQHHRPHHGEWHLPLHSIGLHFLCVSLSTYRLRYTVPIQGQVHLSNISVSHSLSRHSVQIRMWNTNPLE